MFTIIILFNGFFFSECDHFSKSEKREIIDLIEAKCLSKAEIIELITDNCSKNPCQNGHCIDLKNDYRCKCYPGYSGRNCDVKKKCGNGYAGKNCNLPCPVDKAQQGFHIVDGTCVK